MSMYPDESIQDSQADKRLKIYARLFWVFLVTTLVLAATLLLNLDVLSLPGQDASPEPISSSSPSASPTESTSSSAVMDYCNSVVETMPGDLEVVLSWGWEVDCVESGDPLLGEQGELYTYGYADELAKRIAIDASEVTASTIAHEAAHAIDYEQLFQSDRDAIASKYGADSWGEGSDYFNIPSEMFAEGRARCLGYESYIEFGEMSCEDIDSLIAGTQKADQIYSTENPAA
jgi:hypothetical protein